MCCLSTGVERLLCKSNVMSVTLMCCLSTGVEK